MGITDQQILDTASRMFHEYGQAVFERGRPGFFEAFTEVIPTDSEENEIDLLGALPTPKEWEGREKTYQAMRAYSSVVKLKSYEASFRLGFKKVRYDRTGLLGRRISAFFSPAGSGGRFYDKLATDRLLANPVGYDGVAIFSSSHPHGPDGANQSNITTSALSFAVHDAVVRSMTERRDENGEPFAFSPKVMMCGPKNRARAMEITKSTERLQLAAADGTLDATASGVAAAAVPNVYAGGEMNLIINPRLVGTYDDYVFYFDSDGVKPILCYEGRAPEPHDQTEMDSEGRFTRNELRFSLEADQGYGPGLWQSSHAIIL